MRTLFITLALVGFGCGSDGNKAVDAAVKPIDAPAVVPPDCTTYCTTIKANCTGLNAQYVDDAHCMAMCAKFPVGTAADMSMNTLGCRLYHAGNAAKAGQTPDVHCPHAGPGGAAVSNLATPPSVCGDACTSFCTAEIATCGSLDAPIAGIPAQFKNLAACMTACGGADTGFDKKHLYTIDGAKTPAVPPAGDSLACRMYHLTNAAASAAAATTHCPHTGATGGANAATCMAGTAPTP